MTLAQASDTSPDMSRRLAVGACRRLDASPELFAVRRQFGAKSASGTTTFVKVVTLPPVTR
jgi:hypothetical protein